MYSRARRGQGRTRFEFLSFLGILWPDMIEIEDVLFVGDELVEEFLLDGLEALGAEGGDES